ncbi:uncharacterized protein LOC111905627 [Lactuca sativa]|uniref:N-acetyltransferase domain-containing protein n=1 Tax=Lactuca sativa TaxID=4236 RepID=A0A9R1UM81_LACSA|nr:uncharacterized protein LOC111905627 [Lactuca sativa]KAJ0189961.1 hypothetical protein LSAT_V11C800442630 [Lactuca sativa]
MAGSSVVLTELHWNSTSWAKVVGEIASLEKKTFPEHQSYPRSFDDELKNKNNGLIYMEINGDLAGYVMYSCTSFSAIITAIAVKENYRRQGHGDALLKAVIKKCRSKLINRVSLHVDPLRTPAMNLYKKLGFEIETLLKGYYSLDRDAYMMCLDFDEE